MNGTYIACLPIFIAFGLALAGMAAVNGLAIGAAYTHEGTRGRW